MDDLRRIDWKKPYGEICGVDEDYPSGKYTQDGIIFNVAGREVLAGAGEDGEYVYTGEPQGIDGIPNEAMRAALKASPPEKPKRKRRTKKQMEMAKIEAAANPKRRRKTTPSPEPEKTDSVAVGFE